jgi:hypothetical protein
MLREQREELWILAERITTRAKLGCKPCIREPNRARLPARPATPEYVDSIDVSALDFFAANLLTFSPSPFPALM